MNITCHSCFAVLVAAITLVYALFAHAEEEGADKSTTPALAAPVISSWDVWIPGAVTYSRTDTEIIQEYSPGAALNRLTIQKDGTYLWGEKKGKLVEVRPWYAEEDRHYYRIEDLRKNTYDFWYKPETDRLIVLFGEVGGHAATGVRLNPQVEAKQSEPQLPIGEQKPADESSSSNSKDSTTELHKPGDKIEIEWSGQWYKGSVLEVNDGKFKVRYTDWGSLYDEWVSPDRVRRLSQ